MSKSDRAASRPDGVALGRLGRQEDFQGGKMKKPNFYKWLFVRHEKDSDGTTIILAYENQVDSVEDNGPTFVATYQLVKVNKLSKGVRFEK